MSEYLPGKNIFNEFGYDQDEIDLMEREDEYSTYSPPEEKSDRDLKMEIEYPNETDWEYLHQVHLECGGSLTDSDFRLAYSFLLDPQLLQSQYENIASHTKRACKNQFVGIASHSGIQVCNEEIQLYNVLRIQQSNGHDTYPPNTKPLYKMEDTELAREIFILTDPCQSKFDTLIEVHPRLNNIIEE